MVKRSISIIRNSLKFLFYGSLLLWAGYFIGTFASGSRHNVNEIVIIDPGVKQSELLLMVQNRKAQVFHLNDHENGLLQIYNILKDKRNVSALHIVSHGENGLAHLGNTHIDIENIGLYKDVMAQWKKSFNVDGSIIFYGCNMAKDVQGKKFIDNIKALTGITIYASDNVTGSESHNADSVFEYQSAQSPSQ